TTASVDKWTQSVAGDPAREHLLQQILAALSDDDLAVWGFTRESLWAPLAEVAPERAQVATRRARAWDRHHLQRRVLLHLRRNIHHNALGRLLKRARSTLDVLLRE